MAPADGSESDNSSLDSSEEEDVEVLDGMPRQDPDVFEDYFYDDEGRHWLSEDHLLELQTSTDSSINVPPPLSSWTQGEPTEEPELTVAKARRVTWDQGKMEINLHLENVKNLPSLLGSAPSTSGLDKVYQYLFGSTSKLCRLFVDKLGLSKVKYLQFLLTFFKSCRYRMTVPNLHASDDNFPLLMPAVEYNQIWSTISGLQRHAHGESFWQEVEATFNEAFKTLFMEGETHLSATGIEDEISTFLYVLGLDDDKLHYNYTKKTKTDGLKKDHHAKDNRHGFTAHTCCHSATAAPINVSFQRKSENVKHTTERMMDVMFGSHTGRVNRLDNVDIAMDRGYWDPVLLFRLLDQGCNVHGTIKRMDWVPLTFDRGSNLPFPTKPLDIPKKGFKDSFHMQTKWKGKQSSARKVACIGYRSGTGTAVSIALSSRYRRLHWDLIPQGNSDLRWYHDKELSEFDRQKKGMVLFEGEDPDNECRQLILDEVDLRTCGQGSVDWFMDRQLSGTSSTIAGLILAVAPTVDVTDEEICNSFKKVLEYAGYKGDIVGTGTPQPEESEDEEDNEEKSQSSNERREDDDTEENEEEEEEEIRIEEQAKNWVATLTDMNVDMDEEFRREADTIGAETLSWIVALFKKKEYKLMKVAASMKALNKDILPQPKERRPYVMQTAADLKKLATELNIKTTGLKKDALIDQLVAPEAERTLASNSGKKKTLEVDKALLPLHTLFKKSFLRKLPDAPRRAADIGHRNEEPFLKAFFNECKKENNGLDEYSFSSIDPVAIFRLGLVRKKGSKFAKASLDAATFIKDEYGLPVLVPTEVKSRVSPATLNEAKDRIEGLVGAELYNPRAKYLVDLSSDEDLLQVLLHDDGYEKREKSESFQLLHGVYVTGATQGLLLVGSNNALMYGLRVSFRQDLLEAYEKVIDYIYETLAKPFFESSVEDLKANEDIPRVLESIEYMDTHSFWTTYMLWRRLNVDGSVRANSIKFPLPPCARCIPFQNACWNVFKKPSDTTTKLLDNVEEKLGIRTPRTIATARLLSVGSVAFHRSNQILSAKAPDMYSTLFHYRHAANNRFSMGSSLGVLIGFIKDEYSRLNVNQRPNRVTFEPNPRLVAPNTPPRRGTRASQDAPQRVEWSHISKTGYTPMKGRTVNEAHKLRERHCDGRVLVALIADPNDEKSPDVRSKCRLCGAKTNHYCTGCKNYFCFGVSQGLTDKRVDTLMSKDADSLFTERPKTTLKLSCFDPKTEQWTASFMKNSCYLIHHKHAFDRVWGDKRAVELEFTEEEESG